MTGSLDLALDATGLEVDVVAAAWLELELNAQALTVYRVVSTRLALSLVAPTELELEMEP